MTDIMIDIETLGIRSNSVILSIGAVRFNRYEQFVENDDYFYRVIDIKSCEDLGMTKDVKTVEWWNNQPQASQDETLFNKNKVSIQTALTDLTNWIQQTDVRKNCIWSHGATFDIPMLTDAYNLCGMKIPWFFWNARDTRTIFDIANVSTADLGEADHHPVRDCYRQIKGVVKAFSKIKRS